MDHLVHWCSLDPTIVQLTMKVFERFVLNWIAVDEILDIDQ